VHEPPLDHFGRPDSGTAFAFAATEAGVRSAMEKMRDVLRAHDLGAMNVGLAEIVLAETCNNIVEHAYDNTGNGEIKISLRCTGGPLIAELTDPYTQTHLGTHWIFAPRAIGMAHVSR